MIRNINLLLLGLLLVGAVLYVVNLNGSPITIALSDATSITATGGILFIGIFVAGFITAAILSSLFLFKAFIRESRLHKNEHKRKIFYSGLLKARSFLALHEWKRARDAWEKIVKKDPTDIIARVELSRSLEGNGNIKEALNILDKARAQDPTNPEVLLRATELNIALGNKTAAIDNLALVLYHHPTKRAAELARDLSENIGRFDDALEYHKQLEELGIYSEEHGETKARLNFKKLLKEQDPEDAKVLVSELRQFIKKNQSFVPAIHKLAELLKDSDQTEEAATLLVKAAKLTGSSDYWYQAAKLWVEKDKAENAIAAARRATKETEGKSRLQAELDYIKLHIALNKLEDARISIDGFSQLAKSLDYELEADLSQQLLVLKGLCLNRLGKFKESAEVWKKLSKYDFRIEDPQQKRLNDMDFMVQPAPRLSTP